jgi:hypothetical protein
MKQASLVASFAIRELWMTFRLVVVLGAFIGGAALAGLVPAVPAVALERIALALGVAAAVTCAVVASTIATERAAGRTGWLVTRSVTRGTYLVGWFVAFAAIALVGVAGAGLLGWTASAGLASGPAPTTLAVILGAVVATVAAAIALGLGIGALLPALPAAIVAAVACAALGVVSMAGISGAVVWPSAAFRLIADLAGAGTGSGDPIRAAGIGLLATAAFLVGARAAMERADL